MIGLCMGLGRRLGLCSFAMLLCLTNLNTAFRTQLSMRESHPRSRGGDVAQPSDATPAPQVHSLPAGSTGSLLVVP